MKLSDFFFKKQEVVSDTYLGLFLKESEGVVLFIKLDGARNRVIANKKFKYSNGWENIIEDLDETIYKIESETKQSPNKSIFFIYSHLVDRKTKEIKAPYLEKIKLLVKNLELDPLGYIECHEAVAESLTKKNQSPLTGVLIEFDKTNIDLFIYRAGRLVFEENLPRTDHLIEDLLPSFEKVRSQIVIPSRIILYNSSDLDKESSSLLTYSWKEDFFVQMPKVQVIHEEDLIEALIDIFSGQIQSSDKKEQSRTMISESKHSHAGRKEDDLASKEVMGFAIGKDVEEIQETVAPANLEAEIDKSPAVEDKIKFKLLTGSLLGIIKYLSNSVTGLRKFAKIPNSVNKNLVFPIAGLILIFAATFLIEYLFHKATIDIQLPSKNIEKDIQIAAFTGSKESGKDSLHLQIATETANFNASKSTTGKREVGEKAKGSVTIYNSSLSEGKSFSKGTVLNGPNNLKFSLDNDLKIASASGDASSVTSSTAKASITANEIGPESNLTSGTKFSIEGQSNTSVLAKNDSALSGGSKKQIKTVSKQDLDNLRAQIIKKGQDFSEKKSNSKISGDSRLLDKLTQINTQEQVFSKEVGEEAESMNLKSKLAITYFSYKNKDLIEILKPLFVDKKNPELVVNSDKISYKIGEIEENEDDYKIEVAAKAKLTKNVSEEELTKKLVLKNKNSLDDIIKKDTGAVSMEFKIENPIFILKNFTPLFKKNINLEVSYK